MSEIRRYRFPSEHRIKRRFDYTLIRNRGVRLRTPRFYIHVLATDTGYSRLGITVSKKVGNAVLRNRVKRLVREFYRLNVDRLPSSADISIVARFSGDKFDFDTVTKELSVLFGLTPGST